MSVPSTTFTLTAGQTITADKLPPELRQKYEDYKNRASKNHPLYAVESTAYGKAPRGVATEIKPPQHGKTGGFSDTFSGTTRTSGLNTAISKHRFMAALDPM